jgi:hypothetical protein
MIPLYSRELSTDPLKNFNFKIFVSLFNLKSTGFTRNSENQAANPN